MIRLAAACLAVAVSAAPLAAQSSSDIARWQREAGAVTITRDDWGIAHVHGKTDADAVFGMIYAQAEDDFNRIETNYLFALGRTAQAEGESAIMQDLRARLYIQDDSLKAMYTRSPKWLQKLMDAWADGLNFYLYKHSDVKPRALSHFEPWMALSFSEGSIGGDIETISLRGMERMYGDRREGPTPRRTSLEDWRREPTGSNGIAIAPSNTVNHHALFLINPHTSFFFRSELQMTSDEGLNAYGAVTWGQFFVYQGWNPRLGWMHTSTGADAIDEYLETMTEKGGKWFYQYGGQELPVESRQITVPFKTDSGMASKTFTAYFTRHGPVVGRDGDKWLSVAMMFEPIKALTQSYTRTRAKSFKEFKQIMELHTNSSNNTIYADADGNIAYFHANFIPRRDTSFDWTQPVDGSNPKTDWHGLLSVDESPNVFNPKSGWVYNSNNWPWSAAGPSSPKQADFPKYVEKGNEESFRGMHAIRVLWDKKDFTLQGLIDAAFDSYQPGFAELLPPLIKSFDSLPPHDTRRLTLEEQVDSLRAWDYRWSASSVPTTLAVFWGTGLAQHVGEHAREAGKSISTYMVDGATTTERLDALTEASRLLTRQFGSWKTPWGEINRFQRNDSSIVQKFDDSKPSDPIPFTSARWGSLASFGARPYPGTRRWYGTSGNSFVAVVEFGDSVTARAVTAGGESGHPSSPHFKDEVSRYASGDLRPVYYYPSQLKGHTERVYHPGR
jgi:acyl-homoserine-lactone acylase